MFLPETMGTLAKNMERALSGARSFTMSIAFPEEGLSPTSWSSKVRVDP